MVFFNFYFNILSLSFCIVFAYSKTWKYFFKSFLIPAAAGFTQEWQSNTSDRITRRQIEVQANDVNNPSQYRTVTTDHTPDPAFQPPEEESEF